MREALDDCAVVESVANQTNIALHCSVLFKILYKNNLFFYEQFITKKHNFNINVQKKNKF